MPQSVMDSAKPRIESIQYLRAVAALMVVFCHASDEMLHRHISYDTNFFIFWSYKFLFGVDIFFIISGFTMYYISEPQLGLKPYPFKFIVNRIFRVVPLYWVVITVSLLISILSPDLKRINAVSGLYLLKSYLFIPANNPVTGATEPFVGLGWSLDYEMYFYVLFALIVLGTRNKAFIWIVMTLPGLVLLGYIIHPSSVVLENWSHNLLLEFTLGILIAKAFLIGVKPRRFLCWGAVWLGAILWLLIGNWGKPPLRGLEWGIPAAMIVGGTIFAMRASPAATGVVRRLFLQIGNASYSLYLTHLFVMRPCSILLGKLHLSGPIFVMVYIPVFSITACGFAVLSYKYFEVPVARFAHRVTAKWGEAKRPPGAGQAGAVAVDSHL